jgi:hypothetical protein
VNIFVLDKCPKIAAKSLCDKHVVKMVLESAQMLSTALWQHNVEAPYKPAYINHPCTLWSGKTRSNFDWLLKHSWALLVEYQARYQRVHKSLLAINFAEKNRKCIPAGPLTDFVQAMPEEYKKLDPIAAYRSYYLGEKMSFATWKRNKPNWIKF